MFKKAYGYAATPSTAPVRRQRQEQRLALLLIDMLSSMDEGGADISRDMQRPGHGGMMAAQSLRLETCRQAEQIVLGLAQEGVLALEQRSALLRGRWCMNLDGRCDDSHEVQGTLVWRSEGGEYLRRRSQYGFCQP